MAFPVQDSNEADVRALIAKAAKASDGREAMMLTQAALNAAHALVSLKLMAKEDNP